jgi:hypothetical protein
MKKLFYFAFMAMLCCGFTACGGDDNEGVGDVDNLIGKWTLVKDVWSEDGERGVDTYDRGELVICFYEDGTGYEQMNSEGQSWTCDFDYAVSGNKLRIVYEGDPEPFVMTITTLNANQLVLLDEGYDEDDDFSYKYESYYVRY